MRRGEHGERALFASKLGIFDDQSDSSVRGKVEWHLYDELAAAEAAPSRFHSAPSRFATAPVTLSPAPKNRHPH